MDCLFCKIISGEIPSTKVYEDENIYAFKDINPEAPCHVLVIPKKHIASMDEVTAENSSYVAKIFEKIPEIAKLRRCCKTATELFQTVETTPDSRYTICIFT